MFESALTAETLRCLRKLGENGVLGEAYLAGGTALALRFGHRLSIDLDFFTPEKFVEVSVEQRLRELGEFVPTQQAWQTVMGELDKVKFSLFYYDYPLIRSTDDFAGVRIASEVDIAAMKLLAVGDRGTRRDFVDLFFLKDKYGVEEMLGFLEQKYGLEDRKYHILRGLRYFTDAEDPTTMPTMLKKVDWEEIKRYFEEEVKRLSRKWGIGE